MSLLAPALPCQASLLPRACTARRRLCARRCAPAHASRRRGLFVAAAAASADVVVVGAGVAGLLCARTLQQARPSPVASPPCAAPHPLLPQAGVDALLLEASDGVGGRVRTDEVEVRPLRRA